tara:strand:- start:1155 stop:1442 length:288 start_codon:yes stop_codon:yes gene_type:complete
MKYINNEEVLSYFHQQTLNGFTVSEQSMSGTIEWYNPDNEKTILATPNWTDEGIVPIDMSMGDDYENVGEVVLSGSIDEQLTQYATVVESVLAVI